jgi:sugar phosphate isomerase/epimerase
VLADASLDVAAASAAMEAASICGGYVMLSPIRVPVPDAQWADALAELPLVALRAEALGFRRAVIVVMPFHETLPFEQAMESNVRLINQLTNVLDDHGIALGLEYVSPVTRRAPYHHEFIHNLAGALNLIARLDSSKAGLLLDSFHWHCAGETAKDLERLCPSKIVAVHVNDALPIPTAEQTVGERAMPGATGVIDIAAFMGALTSVGYDGPITCEPMASAINALGDIGEDGVVAAASKSLDAIMVAG